MTKPLTQKEFDYYYAQTGPAEPKPMREIHAVRLADADYRAKVGWERWIKETNREARKLLTKHKIDFHPVEL